MTRPDLDTLACVNAACQLFRRAGASNLIIRKVYGHDRLRLLRCRTCGEEFSERRGTALYNTKLPEPKAAEVINHLDAGRTCCAVKEECCRKKRWVCETVAVQHRWKMYGSCPQSDCIIMLLLLL